MLLLLLLLVTARLATVTFTRHCWAAACWTS
jgi:hypothetical protein